VSTKIYIKSGKTNRDFKKALSINIKPRGRWVAGLTCGQNDPNGIGVGLAIWRVNPLKIFPSISFQGSFRKARKGIHCRPFVSR
jgi:hypothetical protein